MKNSHIVIILITHSELQDYHTDFDKQVEIIFSLLNLKKYIDF